MTGLFWGLFKYLKDKPSYKLTIDQYYDFVKAFTKIDRASINSKEELISFCKLFWLNDIDPYYSDQFNNYFEQFTDWDSLHQRWNQLTEPNQEKAQFTPPVERPSQKKIKKKFKKSDVKIPEPKKYSASKKLEPEQNWSGFNLVLKEQEGEQIEYKPQKITSKFRLNDEVIYPFPARKFTQFLRTSNTKREWKKTDRLNVQSMVKDFSMNGYIENIIVEQKDTVVSEIVLFTDRSSSMLSYEFLENYLKEVLHNLPNGKYDHYHFMLCPRLMEHDIFYFNSALNPLKDIKSDKVKWNDDTRFIILSDLGANIELKEEDMEVILKFYFFLKNISTKVIWINPMNFNMLNDGISKSLQMIIPMYDLNEKNLLEFLSK